MSRCISQYACSDSVCPSDFSRPDVHEKQQAFSDKTVWSQYLHLGEIRRRRDVLLRFDELIPVAAFPAFRIGNDAEVIQYVLDCRCADIVSEILHGSGNPVVAPIRTTLRQQENLLTEIREQTAAKHEENAHRNGFSGLALGDRQSSQISLIQGDIKEKPMRNTHR